MPPGSAGCAKTGVLCEAVSGILAFLRMPHRRGNPNWGRPIPPPPALATEFEVIVKRLCLIPEKYGTSPELKNWCERNRNRCYIPEWLLKEWGIIVEIHYGHDAA
jgi:hypothetical protein